MANFLLLYHGGHMPESPEEGVKVMKAWADWFETLGEALVDGGNPTSQAKTINTNGSVTASGPSSSSGYSVIAADNIDHAVRLAKDCPVLAGGVSIEVAETLNTM